MSERYEKYLICKERGHQPSCMQLTSNPSWMLCKHCGTKYRYERKLIEHDIPEETK